MLVPESEYQDLDTLFGTAAPTGYFMGPGTPPYLNLLFHGIRCLSVGTGTDAITSEGFGLSNNRQDNTHAMVGDKRFRTAIILESRSGNRTVVLESYRDETTKI